MNPDARDHPNYPFRPEFLAAFSERGLAFVDGPDAGSPEHALLAEFLGLTHAFAFLERIVQGQVICDLPVHLDRILAGVVEPEDEGERLAAEENELLDWTPESADSLVDALDAIGVKIFCRDDPDEATERSEPRIGAFAFEADAGPAFMVDASPHTPEAAFIAAHELGHLTADVDPYRPRLCRWDPRTLINHSDRPEEARADRFARALLMPRDAFIEALRELEDAPDEGPDLRAEQLAALFGVPIPVAVRRLLDVEVPLSGPIEDAIESTPTPASPAKDATPPTESTPPGSEATLTLPERFVNLALACYAGRVLDIDSLARFLRVTPAEAAQVADLAGVTPRPADEWD